MKSSISTAQPCSARAANQRRRMGRYGQYSLVGMALGCALSNILLVNACSENHLVVVLDKADAGQIGGAGGQTQAAGGQTQSQGGTGGQTQSQDSTGGQSESLGGTSGQFQFPGGAGGQSQFSGGTSGCLLVGDDCSAGTTPCCIGSCAISSGRLICQADPPCISSGVKCSENASCCSNVCDESLGECPTMTSCSIVGEYCSKNMDCCSGACVTSIYESATCQPMSGCRPIGEICSQASDCCSSTCAPDKATEVSRCALPPDNCIHAGDLCSNTSQPAECCDSKPGGSGIGFQSLCIVTDTGTARCKAPGQSANNGAPCQLPEQCRSHYCLPSSGGIFTCAPSCAPKQAACRASLDCCTGYCSNGICRDSGVACHQLGVSCQDGKPCCSGMICDGSPSTCRIQSTVAGM